MKKRLTQKCVLEILDELGRMPQNHHLADKPIGKWDSYDKSNWNAIIRKTIYEKKWRRK